MTLPKNHICEKATFGHLIACGRCSLVCPIEQADEVMRCSEKNNPKITLAGMSIVVCHAAAEIEQSQAARVKTGDRATPHMGELNKAAVFRAIDRLLVDVNADSEFLDRLKNKNGS